MTSTLRDHAIGIWRSAVDAVRPEPLLRAALAEPRLAAMLRSAPRILVLGAGKAGGAMSEAVEAVLAEQIDRIEGWVNVPEGTTGGTRKIHLHPARPAGSNHPTAAGVEGANRMLQLASSAGPEDVALCLLSGGGSALLPAPADGVTLEDKQAVTKLLHACGATIQEMNCVRKHLSAIKGGRLAEAFRGKAMTSLIISDVVGDPLDVIASGPTAPDPTTFADAWHILERFGLADRIPPAVKNRLRSGMAGAIAETCKSLPACVENRILGNNALALVAAEAEARRRGFGVLNLGSFIEGETREVAVAMAGIIRSIRDSGNPMPPPVCILSGGETTVTLGSTSGKGGRNQEFTLALLHKLGQGEMRNIALVSGGTDGEDGPTDAAGAVADETTWPAATALRLSPAAFLVGHDAYPFFDRVGGLLRTGLTQTNVMDVRVILIG
jgi:glycerate 2-kinase